MRRPVVPPHDGITPAAPVTEIPGDHLKFAHGAEAFASSPATSSDSIPAPDVAGASGEGGVLTLIGREQSSAESAPKWRIPMTARRGRRDTSIMELGHRIPAVVLLHAFLEPAAFCPIAGPGIVLVLSPCHQVEAGIEPGTVGSLPSALLVLTPFI